MTSTLRLLMALAAGVATASIDSLPAAAQTVETHWVEIISAEDVGPFQPTHQAFQAEGFSTEKLAESIVTGWNESDEHRKNMLLPAATDTGVAVVQSRDTGVYFAVQEFGRPKSAAIEFRIANRTEATVRYKLDDHEYELLPRFVRTHAICLPEDLTLLNGEETVATLHPTDGDRFNVNGSSDRLRVDSE